MPGFFFILSPLTNNNPNFLILYGIQDPFMKQLTLNIKDNKYKFFKELVDSMDFVKIISEKEEKERRKKEALVKSIKAGLDEVEQIKKGKLKSIPLKDLLNEL